MFNHTLPEMILRPHQSALVLTDMQNDFLAPTGAAHRLIEQSLAEHDTDRRMK